jgi:hypothetical protein
VRTTASWLAVRRCSAKSGAAHISSVRPVAAEHAGEDVQALGGDDLASRGQAHAASAHLVGGPDVPFGVKRAAVGTELQLGRRLLAAS